MYDQRPITYLQKSVLVFDRKLGHWRFRVMRWSADCPRSSSLRLRGHSYGCIWKWDYIFRPWPIANVLAVERYLCITRPILYRVHFTTAKIASLIGVIWFIHIARITAINYCIPRGIVQLQDVKLYTLLLYAVCILFCLIGNISILCFMKRNDTQSRALHEGTGNQSQTGSTSPRTRSQRRFVVTMVIVTSCIVVTIVPFTVLMFLLQIQDVSLPAEVIQTVRMTYFLNFVINPALYFWRMPRYRKSIITVLCCRKPSSM